MQQLCLQGNQLQVFYGMIYKKWNQNLTTQKERHRLTKNICCPNKSTCCNIRGNPSTTKYRGRIVYYSIDPSQLLEQEKCRTNTNNCSEKYVSGEKKKKRWYKPPQILNNRNHFNYKIFIYVETKKISILMNI